MKYKIEMRNITKIFGTLKANDHVNLKVKSGEIHALLGENGAGKSTLMSILFGLYKPEEGSIFIDGKEVNITNPNVATQLGIGMVHQHFKLVDTFTVLENITLGVEDTKYGFVDYQHAREKIQKLMDMYKLEVDLDAYIKDLSVGQQQRVEILKMLYKDSEILIFDEPTAVLTPQEIQELIHSMRSFVKEGKTIILITHKLNEIKDVADRCTILQLGKVVGEVDVPSTSIEKLASIMVGREVLFRVNKEDVKPGEVIFKAENICISKAKKLIVDNVSFEVKSGEIVGIAGIEGNGQTELIHGITGLIPMDSGTTILNGVDMTNLPISKKYELGLSHIPEDRQKHGLILDFTLSHNEILQRYYKNPFAKKGFLQEKTIRNYSEALIDNYDIRTEGRSRTLVRSMSGGNQQKAIIAREMDRNHRFLIAVQPTRGLDVGAIEYIQKSLLKERSSGVGVLLVSLELEEILNLSDRILVMYEGKIVKELDPKKTTTEEIGFYMAGGSLHEHTHESNRTGI